MPPDMSSLTQHSSKLVKLHNTAPINHVQHNVFPQLRIFNRMHFSWWSSGELSYHGGQACICPVTQDLLGCQPDVLLICLSLQTSDHRNIFPAIYDVGNTLFVGFVTNIDTGQSPQNFPSFLFFSANLRIHSMNWTWATGMAMSRTLCGIQPSNEQGDMCCYNVIVVVTL